MVEGKPETPASAYDAEQMLEKEVYLLNRSTFNEGGALEESVDYTRSSQMNNTLSVQDSLEESKIDTTIKEAQEPSQMETRPKNFVSQENPLALKRFEQKGRYVWYATYYTHMHEDQLRIALSKLPDTSFPLEIAASHLKGY